jgi:hypothetical protein
LASRKGKLKHLGVPDAPKKYTLAYASKHRPWWPLPGHIPATPGKMPHGDRWKRTEEKVAIQKQACKLDSRVIDL